jgi:hypothetical protein
MFAPAPMKEDGWYVVPGTLENGKQVDVVSGREGPVSWERPLLVSATYRSDRWQCFLWHLWEKEYAVYLLHYGRYLCRSWNRVHPVGERLKDFQIDLMWMPVPRGQDPRTITKKLLWSHQCF